MKLKRMWVAWHDDGDECSLPSGVFETAFKCKKAIDEAHSFDYSGWARAEPWKVTSGGMIWRRKDGWMAEEFIVGELEF